MMTRAAVVVGIAFVIAGCGATTQRMVRIDSEPTGALVVTGQYAGVTPAQRQFQFSERQPIWAVVKKRGYQSARVALKPDTPHVTVSLKRATDSDGQPLPDNPVPIPDTIQVVMPRLAIHERGFNSEQVAEQASRQAARRLRDAIAKRLQSPATPTTRTGSIAKAQRTLWREIETLLALANPIEIGFENRLPHLENRSGRNAARTLAAYYGTTGLLFVDGTENVETRGMVAGKVGMLVAGTAVSYQSAYQNALARGDSMFVYNIYVPEFAQGLKLQALLLNATSGEVVWMNGGHWPVIPFDKADVVDAVAQDLVSGIRNNRAEESR